MYLRPSAMVPSFEAARLELDLRERSLSSFRWQAWKLIPCPLPSMDELARDELRVAPSLIWDMLVTLVEQAPLFLSHVVWKGIA